MLIDSYPQSVIFIVLGIGIPLAMIKPYMAFLFAVSLLTAGNTLILNQTRVSFLGPYLNLGDACLLIAIAALFFAKFHTKEPLRLPSIIPLLLFVLTIGACQSIWKLGWTYETARAYRWALQLPIVFFIGGNLVNSPARAKRLLWALLIGTVLAAIQHLFYVYTIWQSLSLNMQMFHLTRTIAYSAGGMTSAFLVAGLIWRLPASPWKKIISLTVGMIFLGSLILNQSRSLWLATAGTAFFIFLFFQGYKRLSGIICITVLVVLMSITVGWLYQHSMPGLSIKDIVVRRIELLFDRDKQEKHIGTRKRSFDVEMKYWLDGTLVFGRGLYFYQTIENPEDNYRRVAFGHLGYVTYLSQLGFMGFLIYGFYLPLSIYRAGRRLWRHGESPVIRYIGLLGATSIVCLSILFLMSSSFLGSGYSSVGVLYGAVWSLDKIQRRELHNQSVCQQE